MYISNIIAEWCETLPYVCTHTSWGVRANALASINIIQQLCLHQQPQQPQQHQQPQQPQQLANLPKIGFKTIKMVS